jgi:hypothetical protein
MKESAWKVVYYYADRDEKMIVRGWKPILRLVRAARAYGVRYVDVGSELGPFYVRFVMC